MPVEPSLAHKHTHTHSLSLSLLLSSRKVDHVAPAFDLEVDCVAVPPLRLTCHSAVSRSAILGPGSRGDGRPPPSTAKFHHFPGAAYRVEVQHYVQSICAAPSAVSAHRKLLQKCLAMYGALLNGALLYCWRFD